MGRFSASSASTLLVLKEAVGCKASPAPIFHLRSVCDVFSPDNFSYSRWMLSNAKVVLTRGRMISYLAISLVDAIFWRHSDGVCLLKLGIADSVTATIKHLDEFNGIYQGQHGEEESVWAKDFIKLYTLVWQYSSRHFLFPVGNVCKNEPNSLETFIALSANSSQVYIC